MNTEEHIDKIVDTLRKIPMNELTILTGGNGKGKSLIRKQMPFAVQRGFPEEVTEKNLPSVCRSVSMQLRTESRPEFGALCNMTHDWPLTPTSVSTYHLIKGLFRELETDENSRRREQKKHYLIIDEPEIGMSRESQLGIAEYIKKQYLDHKKDIYGLLVITHSETIVKTLKDIGTFISLDGYGSAEEWLDREVTATDFERLEKESEELFVAVRDQSKPHKEKEDGEERK